MLRKARLNFYDAPPQTVDSFRAQRLVRTLGDDERGLPIILAIEPAKNMPACKSAERAARGINVFRKMRQAEPQHIHRRRCSHWVDTSQEANAREPAVGAYGQERAHFMCAVVGLILDAANDAIFSNQFRYIGAHHQMKPWVFLSLLCQQVQQILLVDHQDVRVLRLEPAQIEGRERSSRSEQGRRRYLAIAKFMYALSESDLI